MRPRSLRSTLTGLAASAAIALAWPAMAEVVNLKASMNATNEVPPNSSKGTGTLTATYDTIARARCTAWLAKPFESSPYRHRPASSDADGSGSVSPFPAPNT